MKQTVDEDLQVDRIAGAFFVQSVEFIVKLATDLSGKILKLSSFNTPSLEVLPNGLPTSL
jgi:hypothetical protein